MIFLNSITLLFILLFLSACSTIKIVTRGDENTDYIITQNNFDSLVNLWLTKPFNLKDTTEVIQIIRIANRVENDLIMQDTLWIKQDSSTIYNQFMKRYYTEFHKLAYHHKDFITMNDTVKYYQKLIERAENMFTDT